MIEQALKQASSRQVPLRRLLLRLPSYGAGASGSAGEKSWPRYIRITDLTDSGRLRADGILRLHPDAAAPYMLEEGDILIARSGATVGKAFLYRHEMGPAAFAGYLIQFRTDRRKALPGILEAWTRTRHYWSQVQLASIQATIENVNAEKYKNFLVPMVPLKYQKRLLAELDHARGASTRIGRALNAQIALLREHRQALITAAVTGELDVPVVAA
ncbi:MAG TPA: hypothetical protein VFF32_09190, partial [Dermatophilaceae bacterium]|nr:hypothetical protein [Dermatophilaceae bacterium]